MLEFIFNRRMLSNGPTLREFIGPSLDEREYALAKSQPGKAAVVRLHPARPAALIEAGSGRHLQGNVVG